MSNAVRVIRILRALNKREAQDQREGKREGAAPWGGGQQAKLLRMLKWSLKEW